MADRQRQTVEQLGVALLKAEARVRELEEANDRLALAEWELRRRVEDAVDGFPVDRTYSVFGAVSKFREHVRAALVPAYEETAE